MDGFMNPDGSFGDLATAPEGMADLVNNKGWKGVGDLAKAYSELEAFKGVPPERLVTIPDREDDAIGWEEYYTKTGRPKSSKGYKLDVNDNGLKLDDGLIENLKEYAHKRGWSNKHLNEAVQFQLDASKAIVDAQEKLDREAAEAADKAKRETVDAIKSSRGIKTDAELQKLILKGKDVAEKLGVFALLERRGLTDDVEMVDAFIGLSERITEGALPKLETISPADKKQRIAEIMKDKAFLEPMNPNHKAIMEEFVKLHTT